MPQDILEFWLYPTPTYSAPIKQSRLFLVKSSKYKKEQTNNTENQLQVNNLCPDDYLKENLQDIFWNQTTKTQNVEYPGKIF